MKMIPTRIFVDKIGWLETGGASQYDSPVPPRSQMSWRSLLYGSDGVSVEICPNSDDRIVQAANFVRFRALSNWEGGKL